HTHTVIHSFMHTHSQMQNIHTDTHTHTHTHTQHSVYSMYLVLQFVMLLPILSLSHLPLFLSHTHPLSSSSPSLSYPLFSLSYLPLPLSLSIPLSLSVL